MDVHTTIAQTPEQQQMLKQCIAECLNCGRLCELCGSLCLKQDMKGLAKCIERCMNCADMCFLAARFMLRETAFHFKTCALCAEMCEASETACNEAISIVQGSGMERNALQDCAEASRRCAEHCRKMADSEGSVPH